MGCAPINSKVNPRDGDSSVFTANSEKLPREVLEGFSKILKTISTNPGSSRNAQLVKAAAPRNSTLANVRLPDNTKVDSEEHKLGSSKEVPASSGRDQGKETASTRVIENSNVTSESKEISEKKQMILRPIEHKITIKSRLKIEDVKDQELSSEKESPDNSMNRYALEGKKGEIGAQKKDGGRNYEEAAGRVEKEEEILKKPIINKFTLKDYDEIQEHHVDFIEVEEEIKFTDRSEPA